MRTLHLLLFALSLGPPLCLGQLPAAGQQLRDVEPKLSTELQNLSSQGYKQASSEILEVVERGTAKRFPVQLEAGTQYAIIGACGGNCDHVQLSLYGADGALLISSPEKQAVVIIAGTPPVAGPYTLELAAPGCSEQTCQAGFIFTRHEVSTSNLDEKVAPSVTSHSGSFVAHVSSERSRAEALAAYSKLQTLVPDALAKREALVREVNLGQKGVWHRLAIGPPTSEADAQALCFLIKAAGHEYCTVHSSEGDDLGQISTPAPKTSVKPKSAAGKGKSAAQPRADPEPMFGKMKCSNRETTCSAARIYCIRSCARRKRGGGCSNDCQGAFVLCKETGAWSTYYCSRAGLARR